MGKVNTNLLTGTIIRDTFTKVQDKVRVGTFGVTKAVMKGIGKRTKCMATESTQHRKEGRSRGGFNQTNMLERLKNDICLDFEFIH
jgi:hypothetical protein